MEQTIIGYYSADKTKNNFCVSEKSEIIICGRMQDFPPQPENFKFYPVTFPDLLFWIVGGKTLTCLDRSAFQLYAKEFYKMTVRMIANNSAELEQMTKDEFISIKFDFIKLQTNYQLN
jgi:hypothetical protein